MGNTSPSRHSGKAATVNRIACQRIRAPFPSKLVYCPALVKERNSSHSVPGAYLETVSAKAFSRSPMGPCETWGATWLLISLPLGWTWYQWSVRYKLHAQGQDLNAATGRVDASYVREPLAPPLSPLNVIGSLAGALLTDGSLLVKVITAPPCGAGPVRSTWLSVVDLPCGARCGTGHA